MTAKTTYILVFILFFGALVSANGRWKQKKEVPKRGSIERIFSEPQEKNPLQKATEDLKNSIQKLSIYNRVNVHFQYYTSKVLFNKKFNESDWEQMNELATSLKNFEETRADTKDTRRMFEEKIQKCKHEKNPRKKNSNDVKEATEMLKLADKMQKKIDSVGKMHEKLVQKLQKFKNSWKAIEAPEEMQHDEYFKTSDRLDSEQLIELEYGIINKENNRNSVRQAIGDLATWIKKIGEIENAFKFQFEKFTDLYEQFENKPPKDFANIFAAVERDFEEREADYEHNNNLTEYKLILTRTLSEDEWSEYYKPMYTLKIEEAERALFQTETAYKKGKSAYKKMKTAYLKAKNAAATNFQKVWRGQHARKQVEKLKEEELSRNKTAETAEDSNKEDSLWEDEEEYSDKIAKCRKQKKTKKHFDAVDTAAQDGTKPLKFQPTIPKKLVKSKRMPVMPNRVKKDRPNLKELDNVRGNRYAAKDALNWVEVSQESEE